MTHSDYLNLPGINATSIKQGAVSMLHMRHAMTEPSKPATAAMTMGTLTHSAVLEPTSLLTLAAVWDGGAKRGGAYTGFCAAHPGKIIVTPDELANAKGMMDAVRSNKTARDLLDGCQFETTIQWARDGYGTAKCRPDAIKPGCLIDLKTIRSIERRAVERQALSLGHDIQMGWYGLGVSESVHDDVAGNSWLIYVESSPPYDVLPMLCGHDVIERGLRKAVQIATQYRECEATGIFPGVATERDVWSLPDWALGESLEGFDEQQGDRQ